MKQLKKTLLTLVALLAVTAGAWAEEKSETILTNTSQEEYTGEHFKITPNIQKTMLMVADLRYYDSGQDFFSVQTLDGQNISKLDLQIDDIDEASIHNLSLSSGTKSYDSNTKVLTITNVNADYVQISLTEEDQYGIVTISSVTYYYEESGTTVTFTRGTGDKADEWTMDGGMPAGNVTVSVEYFPQAALTEAPTAINDVPATTDGAIVKVGTVANIGSTETAQGTVMYYVSQTALDDDALLALDADQWKADVPTAESLAEGQAYVYYYVRGNDSDTDEENFSDGDINALTVNIAAETTYAVTFADGVNPEPPADPEWTASPNTDVKKGQTVTVTYTGTRKVIGVKAEKYVPRTLADATTADVGMVVCAEGHLHAAKTAVPTSCTAVGILGKVTETGHGLILALQNATSQTWNTINGWTSVTTYAGTTLKQLPAGALGSLPSYTKLGSNTVSNWCVAQKSDYEAIFINLDSTTGDPSGTTYDAKVNAYITTGVGGAEISGLNWSATGYSDSMGWVFYSDYWNSFSKINGCSLRPVLGF